MTSLGTLLFSLFCAYLICFTTLVTGQQSNSSTEARLPEEEVKALKYIGDKLGKHDWDFKLNPCTSWSSPEKESGDANLNQVKCNCTYENNSVCHVTNILLKTQNLSGTLPKNLSGLPYLIEIDLARNYLSGGIPSEWGSTKLTNITLLANRLSGSLPKEIGNIITLKSLVLEFNQLSGILPPELGNLINLERLFLSSNFFTGELPKTLANLTSLKDFRIPDNIFTGKIPEFIGNWLMLGRFIIHGSGLDGPIPSNISTLRNLIDLRITDLNVEASPFPPLHAMNDLVTLVLRNCNITDGFPSYVLQFPMLQVLDLSFNKLIGPLPSTSVSKLQNLYLSGNLLTGDVHQWLRKINRVDLSYNNFSLDRPSPWCQDLNINFFGKPFGLNNSGIAPCLKIHQCSSVNRHHQLAINCGGPSVKINGQWYEEDISDGQFHSGMGWAFSNTGHFLEGSLTEGYLADNTSKLSMLDTRLYTRARLSPLSLTYYAFCLVNGNYTVKLHFSEIILSDEKPYISLGRRIFDVFIQGKLVLADFDIKHEAGGAGKELVRNFSVIVSDETLEIRFYWRGKGTTSIPHKGVYGPLISAISINSGVEKSKNKRIIVALVGVLSSILFFTLIYLSIIWKKRQFGCRNTASEDLVGLDVHAGNFTFNQILAATNNFDDEKKIGEGGFGPVYKGQLSDGRFIAVKQLSSKSTQGSREFLNEIGVISALQHPNLVKLYGCCAERNQLLLVYEYMENNSLARALFGPKQFQLSLDWPTRYKICLGIARGLAFLHEESSLKIVHRDIKATNILLDENLNAKISDFGLAKLDEQENTHISTRIAGTMGYMAPEYAMRGYLTCKADVYSFGIVALEIVSGMRNTNFRPLEECVYLLDWAYVLQERGSLIEIVDPKLGTDFNKEEAMRMIKVSLLCANQSQELRPLMSSVISMLEGQISTEEPISDAELCDNDVKFKALRKHFVQCQNQNINQTQSTIVGPWTESSGILQYQYHLSPRD